MTTGQPGIGPLSRSATTAKLTWAAALALAQLLITPFSAHAAGVGVTPSSASTQPGSAAVFTITVNCHNCGVLLGAAISPSENNGPTLTLSRCHLINGGSASLRVDAGDSTPLMTYTITVTATDTQSGKSQSASVTLTVNDFIITAHPTSVTVPAGQMATSSVTASGLNGFGGTIYYADNMPSATTTGLACNLQPARVTFSATVTAATSTLSCSGTPGTYNVAITGSPFNGSPVRPVTVTINVT
jgi:hypothetical protein